MKYLTLLTSILLINPAQSAPWEWPKFGNILDVFNPNNIFKPPTTTDPAKNTPKPIDNNTSGNSTQNKAEEYNNLSNFLSFYGADLGNINQPKIQQTQPSSTRSNGGIIENIGGNVIQGYVDRNAPLVNDMMKEPNKKYDVSSLFLSPLSGVFDLLSLASGINPIAVRQNQPKGKSVSQQVKEKGGSVTFYDLVDLGVDWIYDNKKFYNAILDFAIIFLKQFPFFLNVVFRIIEKVNPKFDPELTQTALNFLYNYEKNSPDRWKKLTDLIVIFLNKDNGVSSITLRDLIALLGKNPV